MFDYIGGYEFLDLLLNSPQYQEEKRICFQSIRKLVQPLLNKRKFDDDMREMCITTGCKEYVVDSWGSFRGELFLYVISRHLI